MSHTKPPWVNWHFVRAHPIQAVLVSFLLVFLIYGLLMMLYAFIRVVAEGRLVESVTGEFLRVLEALFVGRAWWIGWLLGGLVALYLLLRALDWLLTILRLPFLLADYLRAGTKFYTARSAYCEARRQTIDRAS